MALSALAQTEPMGLEFTTETDTQDPILSAPEYCVMCVTKKRNVHDGGSKGARVANLRN